MLLPIFTVMPVMADDTDSLKVMFDFTTLTDQSGQYGGALKGSAELTTAGEEPVLSLGSKNGYFLFDASVGELVKTFSDYTISVNVFIPQSTDIGGNGNFVWCFSNSSTSGYLFFGAKESRFSITRGSYDGEQRVNPGKALTKGRWLNLVYVQRGNEGRVLIDGQQAAKGTVSLKPSALSGALKNSYLGRSCYSGDAFLKDALMHHLILCNYAMSDDEIAELQSDLSVLNREIEDEAIRNLIQNFTLGDVSGLTRDITLPTSYADVVKIEWESSDESVITPTGHIIRPAVGSPAAHAVLTAHFSTSTVSDQLTFEVSVLPLFTDDEALAYECEHLAIGGNLKNLYDRLTLPTVAAEGDPVFWKSGDTSLLSDDGRVMRFGDNGKQHVTLTATIRRGEKSVTRDFDVCIHQNEPYVSYLFVYFPSNDNENIYYALSGDGYNYTPLNGGKRVVAADSCTVMGGLRDPHILRGEDGCFYMAVTDMRSSLGWNSNRGLVLMRSRDLINWTHATVHFPTRYKGTMWAKVTRVWAPQTIWDPDYENADGTRGRYMVYFSLVTSDSSIPYDKVYYCYVNDDFTDFIGEPRYFYDRGAATIDMDIVYNESDGLYHAIFKNDVTSGIAQVTARRLTPEEGQADGSQWSEPTGNLQQTTVAVEGGGLFKLINQDKWILMYDCYSSGYYQFCSSPDLQNFTFEKNTKTSGAFTPRHGTVIPLTQAETDALLSTFPATEFKPTITAMTHPAIRQNLATITTSAVQIPVEAGTNLTAFDPQFILSAGSTIEPQGPQNFTQGAVTFNVQCSTSNVQRYTVTAYECANPVLPDFHADPEVLFSKKTGRFYVYPTTDGYDGWGGYSFDVFSSPDLVHFQNEGTILSLAAGGDAPWAAGNAWAPCIEEKWMDGQWKYFFYFSAHNASLGKKTIGVATADSPIGPFKASDKPLFTSSSAGQMIDSDVFTDPVSGQSYLYYGNGRLLYRLLGDDMMSVGTKEYDITPSGGTLQTYAYREGVYVFYRNGLYYFLWSVDDTGATNYHVAYGTSTSPTGPIKVASKPIVIIQNANQKIFGTGHNSVLNIPGTDDWYIVYHRINKNYLSNGPGYHREVCIDRLTFADDGTINQVTPTHEGIAPVNVSGLIDGIQEVEAGHTVHRSDKAVYDLQGRRIEKAPRLKGIYISAGRKIIIK